MGAWKSEQLAGRECFVYTPYSIGADTNITYPVVYLHGDKSSKDFLEKADYMDEIQCIIIGIMEEDKLSELTPWGAKSLHPKFPDFSGKADQYIQWIESELKEAVDSKYPTKALAEFTGLTGYSLGGLCSLYASYRSNIFGVIASMSGSFWYPDFVDYAKNDDFLNKDLRVFLSSGDSEGIGHKDIKKDAVEKTKEMYGIIQDKLGENRCILQFDEGGHHNNREERYKTAIQWINKELNKR